MFWTLTTIMPFLDENGKPQKFIAIRKDITDRVKTEEKLRESLQENEKKNVIIQEQVKELEKMDRLKEEFASMVTHELKTPLVPIKGYCKMLLDPTIFGDLNDEQKEAVIEIADSAERLERLIADVLDAQKLDMKKMVFKKELFDVSDMIKTIEKDMVVITKEKDIQFIAAYPREKLIMTSDKSRIIQVLENLVKNAIDFVPPKGGQIELGVEKSEEDLLFHVKDNGIGIDKGKQKYLFKKFYQVDTSASRKHGGTGLGLAICKGIVEGLGGEIWVESDIGKGATFYLTLPVNRL
jgi:signal transduction histidine kinase